MTKAAGNETDDARASGAALNAIIEALEGLRYVQLEVQLHDARVVKIMRTHKIRLYEACADQVHDDAVR